MDLRCAPDPSEPQPARRRLAARHAAAQPCGARRDSTALLRRCWLYARCVLRSISRGAEATQRASGLEPAYFGFVGSSSRCPLLHVAAMTRAADRGARCRTRRLVAMPHAWRPLATSSDRPDCQAAACAMPNTASNGDLAITASSVYPSIAVHVQPVASTLFAPKANATRSWRAHAARYHPSTTSASKTGSTTNWPGRRTAKILSWTTFGMAASTFRIESASSSPQLYMPLGRSDFDESPEVLVIGAKKSPLGLMRDRVLTSWTIRAQQEPWILLELRRGYCFNLDTTPG